MDYIDIQELIEALTDGYRDNKTVIELHKVTFSEVLQSKQSVQKAKKRKSETSKDPEDLKLPNVNLKKSKSQSKFKGRLYKSRLSNSLPQLTFNRDLDLSDYKYEKMTYSKRIHVNLPPAPKADIVSLPPIFRKEYEHTADTGPGSTVGKYGDPLIGIINTTDRTVDYSQYANWKVNYNREYQKNYIQNQEKEKIIQKYVTDSVNKRSKVEMTPDNVSKRFADSVTRKLTLNGRYKDRLTLDSVNGRYPVNFRTQSRSIVNNPETISEHSESEQSD